MKPDIRPDKTAIKWYLKPSVVLIAIIGIGPLAVPLVWLSPAFKRWQKIALSVLIAAVTLLAVKSSVEMYRILLKEMQELQATL